MHGEAYAHGFETWLKDAAAFMDISPGVRQQLMEMLLNGWGKFGKTFLTTSFALHSQPLQVSGLQDVACRVRAEE